MAAEIEKAYRQALGSMSPDDRYYAFLSKQLRDLETQVQFDYLDFDKFPTTEAEVKAELARQADKYLNFGLNKHPEVKMGRGKFKDSLIALAKPLSENFAGRFDIPVAILGQVPARDVYVAAGVGYYLDGLDVRDWSDDPQGWRTPSLLYLTWMQDGVWNLNKTVQDVRASLEADMRGATVSDGSGLYVAHPRILEHHFIDLPGTSVGRGHAPCLGLFYGRPRVHYDWVGPAGPEFGSALCGRN